MQVPKLTPRLKLIAEKVKDLKCGDLYIAADIGTDHAKLPVFLVKTGICSFVYAGDVRPGPLRSASETISAFGCEKTVLPVLSDGLKNIPADYHTVIIAGMGGELIAKILSDVVVSEETLLVLSPMTSGEELRKYLFDSGYDIITEDIAVEGHRVYPVMTAKKADGNISYSDSDFVVSPALLRSAKVSERNKYIAKCIAAENKKIDGRKKAGLLDEEYRAAVVLREKLLQISAK